MILFRYLDLSNTKKSFKMKKLYLIWTCKSTKDFLWVMELLNDVRYRVRELDHQHLYINILSFNKDSKYC